MIQPLKVLRVQAGGREFALDVGIVLGLDRPRRWARLPGAPGYVSGVIEMRGRVVAVVDLAARLALEPAPAAPRPGVVLVESAEPVGLGVDALGDLDLIHVLHEPEGITDTGVRGLTPEGLALLDAEALVDGRALRPLREVLLEDGGGTA